MKKNHFFGLIFTMIIATTVLIACQKEQASVADETTQTDPELMTATAGVGSNKLSGMISAEAAAAMQAAYIKKFGQKDTRSVSFSVKEIKAFLKLIKDKSDSDTIVVNMGVYDKKTAPAPGAVGRLTVFFSGNERKKKSSGSITLNAANAESSNLNHGGMDPQY